MTSVVSPSTVTNGQIGKAADLIEAALAKAAAEAGVPSSSFQQVLESGGDWAKQAAASFIKRCEMQSAAFTVTTLGLTGAEWRARLESGGHRLFDSVKDILSKPDFDQNHRYEAGQTLKVFLVRGTEIQKDSDRTTQGFQAFAKKHGGEEAVRHLKAELTLLIREKFTNKELEEMGLWYIAVLHKPIVDADGDPCVLRASRYGGDSWVGACWDGPGREWSDDGAFAFVAS